MLTFFNIDTLFAYCAWGGVSLYVLRILIGFTGAASSESLDTATDHISDDAFQFLSLNTLIGFLMMFGWGGLAAYRQFVLSEAVSLLIATLSGVVYVFATRLIFSSAKKLTSTGTVFDIQSAVGKQGRVYQKIQTQKKGVIHVILDDFNRELDAISMDSEEIPSFHFVEILKVIDNKTVLVKQVK